MYKVFVNDKVICFTNTQENINLFSNVLVLHFYQEEITPFILEVLAEDTRNEAVLILVDDCEEAFLNFKKYFKLIQAAGGIVSNSKGEKLFIYRLDKWDLPKGKLEKNESIEECAIREVEEECGINSLTIKQKLEDTYHIYIHKDELILKQTFWYMMATSYEGNLMPQKEENITKAEWLTNDEILEKVSKNTYSSIWSLIESII